MSYDQGFTAKQLNGNIAGVKWKSRSDGIARAYGYSYDAASRLTITDFTQQNTGSTNWARDQIDFSVKDLSYDANGNIMSLTQKGMAANLIQTIDSLKYGYAANSNKLSFVTDRRNNVQSLLGDFRETDNNERVDYSYDQNGNLTADNNKHITGITYNHLNLPQTITIPGKGNIRYQYDALGNKLRKEVTDISSGVSKITTTDYIAGMVYQNDTLQFLIHEEGRIRALITEGNPVVFCYDYFLKDHLGNVRTVLTEQTDFSIYTATMEVSAAAKENTLFSNIDNTRVNKPAGYPADDSAGDNAAVAKLSSAEGSRKIGPSLVLRVMAGDTVQLGVKAFYKSLASDRKSPTEIPVEVTLADLVRTFTSGEQLTATHGSATDRPFFPFNENFYNNHYQQLKNNNTDKNQPSRPHAYLNFVMFDEQFKLVESNSGVRQVQAIPDQLQTLATDKIAIQRNGYLYVYTSNETQEALFFDNLVVSQISGPLLEETHYYPFGLTMAGISSNALKGTKYAENYLKYNGKELQHEEFSDGSGLEWYDYGARTYDVQLGRWPIIDQLAEKYDAWSPYHFAYNNPIRFWDPNGKEIINSNPKGSENYKRTQNALSILQQTNPEAYRILNESAVKVYVSTSLLNSPERYEKSYTGNFTKGVTNVKRRVPSSFGVTNILRKGGNPISADIEGSYLGPERLERDAKGIDPKSKKIYTIQEADEFITMDDIDVIIDESITDLKAFTIVLGHEFGHARYAVQNKVEAWKWGELDNENNSLNPGHTPGNPSGHAANMEENTVKNNYTEAWKQIISRIMQYINAGKP
ncbi:RHS repeat-associated core domain-containing protein [Chitinophaga eiseniae]|uniref:RHS repeat-associated core domain-containing protein n=1 Tax=Chitinophaga eiseniae TaxID=634771 RepID=A0A1T4U3T1_9BACT|nr:RHS repeat-associated core domain-containing protein [Chitinophaga eiseniae]SKA47178.1 RHS repeat-associated core domain-containing protein [Chitinophaga eiseniae]